MSRTTPCPSCPWRLDSDPTGAAIPSFSIEMMRNLRSTVGDGDDFRAIMACHWSTEGNECTRDACVGYLRVAGWSNLAVRVATIERRIDMPAIWVACEDLDLYGSFDEMLAAYEAAQSTPRDDTESTSTSP